MDAPAWFEQGNTLMQAGRFEDAESCYVQAIALDEQHSGAHFNLGASFQARSLHHLALPHYERGVALMADPSMHLGNVLNTKMRLCDWRGLDEWMAQVEARVQSGEPTCPPFQVVSFSGSPALQHKAAQGWINAHHQGDNAERLVTPAVPAVFAPRQKAATDKIKLAYFSADFHSHPVSFLVAQMLELHDKHSFELIAFSSTLDRPDDPYQARVRTAFDVWIDIRSMSDADVVSLARQLEIDVAIELTGLTQGGRIGALIGRLAPVQMHYLGYPATTAAPNVDYLIADRTVVPFEQQCHYTEHMLYLPHCFQVSDAYRPRPAATPNRTALGLPEDGFVFCSFCNGYKITPTVFDSWMRILQAVPGSCLMLYADSDFAADNLRREARVRGVPAERLVFGKRVGVPDYLARYAACDLFLDTLPYNAGATANDVLWMGLPLLTCIGQTMTGRMAASLLHTLGLDELIAQNWASYEAIAIALATHPARYAAIKAKLDAGGASSPLFDTAQTTQAIEQGYRMALARYWQGLAPDHIGV